MASFVVVVFEPVFAAPLVAVDVFVVVLAVELSPVVSIVESNMAQPIYQICYMKSCFLMIQ